MNTKTDKPIGDWRRVYLTNIHWVSSDGRVWSDKLGRLLKPSLGGKGYLWVNLGGHIPRAVHRLVAFAFHGDPLPGQEVRHLNGDPSDNRADNLAWGTSSENNIDIVEHGRNLNRNKTHCPQGHPYDDENTHVRIINGRPRRYCKACDRVRSARRQAAGTTWHHAPQ